MEPMVQEARRAPMGDRGPFLVLLWALVNRSGIATIIFVSAVRRKKKRMFCFVLHFACMQAEVLHN